MIKASPDQIIATGTDWRFIKEVRKELGIWMAFACDASERGLA